VFRPGWVRMAVVTNVVAKTGAPEDKNSGASS
jgi:hypothetical protein